MQGHSDGDQGGTYLCKPVYGAFEEVHILSEYKYSSKIANYRRFINNLFFIWLGTEEEAKEFTDLRNTNSWGIKFTANFNLKEIEFLDLNNSVGEGRISTSTFFKKSVHKQLSPIQQLSLQEVENKHPLWAISKDSKELHSKE